MVELIRSRTGNAKVELPVLKFVASMHYGNKRWYVGITDKDTGLCHAVQTHKSRQAALNALNRWIEVYNELHPS